MARTARMTEGQINRTLTEIQKGVRARTLDPSDVAWFLEAVRKTRAYARRHGLDLSTVTVTVTGGFVSNGYGFAADATWLRYRNGEITVTREYAQSRPGGRGDCYVAKVRDPGHRSTGRCAKRAGWAHPMERGQ